MAVQELYERHFFEWMQRNAELLSRGRFDKAEIAHIAEELADLDKRDRGSRKLFDKAYSAFTEVPKAAREAHPQLG